MIIYIYPILNQGKNLELVGSFLEGLNKNLISIEHKFLEADKVVLIV